MTPDADPVATAKQFLRGGLLTARRDRPAADVAAARASIAVHLWPRLRSCAVVCAYLPLRSEPLPLELLDRLHCAGVRVLVPTVATDAPLDWVEHPTEVEPGSFGIATPVGPRLGAGAVTEADVVLVPALAIDREGRRLGRGGGHYDRSLALLPAGGTGRHHGRPELIAVLFDGELLPAVPSDRHDIAVDAVVTPASGLRRPGG